MNESGELQLPEINTGTPKITLAPMIDVVFLLLIFFVVATVFPQNSGLKVDIPQAESARSESADSLHILISSNNQVFAGGQTLRVGQLLPLLRQQLAGHPRLAVFIKADKASETGVLVTVMDACRRAGVRQLTIAARK